MPHAARHASARLLVGSVGVSHRHDHPGLARGIDARSCAEKFRRNREDSRITSGSVEKSFHHFGRWQLDPFLRMNAAARGTDEWTFVVDSEDFGASFVGFVLRGDEASDAFDAAAGIFRTCGHRRRDERSGAVTRDHASDGRHRVVGAFHHVVAAGAVDVHVDEAGNGGQMRGFHFFGAGGEAHALARADRFDHAVADEDSRVWNFGGGSQCSGGVQQSGGHGQANIVAEIFAQQKQNGRSRKLRPLRIDLRIS